MGQIAKTFPVDHLQFIWKFNGLFVNMSVGVTLALFINVLIIIIIIIIIRYCAKYQLNIPSTFWVMGARMGLP